MDKLTNAHYIYKGQKFIDQLGVQVLFKAYIPYAF